MKHHKTCIEHTDPPRPAFCGSNGWGHVSGFRETIFQFRVRIFAVDHEQGWVQRVNALLIDPVHNGEFHDIREGVFGAQFEFRARVNRGHVAQILQSRSRRTCTRSYDLQHTAICEGPSFLEVDIQRSSRGRHERTRKKKIQKDVF